MFGKRGREYGLQHPSDLCTFASITSTTWRSKFSSFMPGTRPHRGFQPHQPAFLRFGPCCNSVWGGLGGPTPVTGDNGIFTGWSGDIPMGRQPF